MRWLKSDQDIRSKLIAERSMTLSPVAGVRGRDLWRATAVVDHLLKHWTEVLRVRRLVGDGVRHDHLRVLVDRKLTVVAL